MSRPKKAKGQSNRLEKQQKFIGGPLGIFGDTAESHDFTIRDVMKRVVKELKHYYPGQIFRHRMRISKKEILEYLTSIDANLGRVLFVQNARIQPDGGIVEVKGRLGKFRAILVSEAKHQGNDVERIRSGIKRGKNKDQDLMTAGNAIERVHKNIREIRNLMLNELRLPYVVFLQGSNFATSTEYIKTPEGRPVKIAHDAGSLNRIDRVTASSFGMEVNKNYCQNIFVELDNNLQMLQAASFYFQTHPWSAKDMASVLWDVALMSLNVLSESLPESRG